MKRVLLLFLFVLMAFAMFDVAYANGPGVGYSSIEILIDDYTKVKNIEIHLSYYDGQWHEKDDSRVLNYEYTDILISEITRKENERIIVIRDEYVNDIYLVVTLKNGENHTTQALNCGRYNTFFYSTDDNSFCEGTIISKQLRYYGIVDFFNTLLFPLLLTLIIELILGSAFRMAPYKYIVIINLITNLTMNLILVLLLRAFIINYITLVLILEIIVMIIEAMYYIKKYNDASKIKIIMYTLIANLGSWWAYSWMTAIIYKL